MIALLLAVVALLGVMLWRPWSLPPTETFVSTEPATVTVSAAPSTQTVTVPQAPLVPTPERSTSSGSERDAAFQRLEELVAQDARIPTVRGQWVAQIDSKAEGIVDLTIQSAPFTVPEILTEHLRFRQDVSYGSLVRLVHQGDWGSIPTPSAPLWVTVVDLDASSSADAMAWCEAHFTQRGADLAHICLPRLLKLKGS